MSEALREGEGEGEGEGRVTCSCFETSALCIGAVTTANNLVATVLNPNNSPPSLSS